MVKAQVNSTVQCMLLVMTAGSTVATQQWPVHVHNSKVRCM